MKHQPESGSPGHKPNIAEQEALKGLNADYTERYGFHDAENYLYKAPKGLTRELVEQISEFKSEPQWMREFRLKSLDHFLARPMPTWGSPMLAEGDFDEAECTVECPRHGSVFDLRTGKPRTLPAYVPVETFGVLVEDDIIKLEVE